MGTGKVAGEESRSMMGVTATLKLEFEMEGVAGNHFLVRLTGPAFFLSSTKAKDCKSTKLPSGARSATSDSSSGT